MDRNRFNIPLKTVEVFGKEPVSAENLNLMLNKYLANFVEINDVKKEIFMYVSRNKSFYESIINEKFYKLKQEKKKLEEGTRNKFEKVLQETNDFFKRLININEKDNFEGKRRELSGRINEIRNSLLSNYRYLEKINQKMILISDKQIRHHTSSRLIVGLGSASVLEASIKLHHIYGVPYIPSTAIKGVLRAYRLWVLSSWDSELFRVFELAISNIYDRCKEPQKEFVERLQKVQKKDLKEGEEVLIKRRDDIIEKRDGLFEIISIFGSQSNKGSLIVFDAFPDKFEGFDIEIMNTHYQDYYQGDSPPADWHNPVPISFLAIPEGTLFYFYFSNPYDSLEKDLKESLGLMGIGSKTSLGYGIFG